MIELAEEAIIALEGCFIECASRMVKGAIPGLEAEVILADKLYEFDRSRSGVDELPEAEVEARACTVAEQVPGQP